MEKMRDCFFHRDGIVLLIFLWAWVYWKARGSGKRNPGSCCASRV